MFTEEELEEIKRELEGISIVVEGKKDKYVLEKLGGKKIYVISGKDVNSFAELVLLDNPKSILILTDFDKEGRKKASIFSKIFQARGVDVNFNLRKKIKKILKINKLEELSSSIKIMEDDYYGKSSSIYYKIFNRGKFRMRWCSRKARRYRCYIWTNRGTTWAGFRPERIAENR